MFTILVAQWIAALPGNIWITPKLPTIGVVLVALGGCWLCLWQGRWRLWGSPLMVLGMATMLLTRPPDIVLGDFGRLLAARGEDGNYYAAPGAEKISLSFLAGETGAQLLPWPDKSEATAGPFDCSAEGSCTYTAHGRRIALVTRDSGLPVPCYIVDAIVAQVPAGFRCKSQIPVVDRIDSWRLGSIALWIGRDGIAIESANLSRGDRPWVPHPVSRREREKAVDGH